MARHDIRLFRLAGILEKQGSREIVSLDVDGSSGMTKNMISMTLRTTEKT